MGEGLLLEKAKFYLKNKDIKNIRNKKNEVEKIIIKFIEDNGLINTKINLNNCYIKYNINETMQPINMEFLKVCLIKYFREDLKNNSNSELNWHIEMVAKDGLFRWYWENSYS